MRTLTRGQFEEFKRDFEIYGTHTEKDQYRNEQTIKDDTPRGTIHTMWHPITDAGSIAEYGKDISRMYYAIVYDDPGIVFGDVVEIRGEEYEVVGVKLHNTHTRVEIRRKVV